MTAGSEYLEVYLACVDRAVASIDQFQLERLAIAIDDTARPGLRRKT